MITKNITTPMWTKSVMYQVIEVGYYKNIKLQREMAAQWEMYEEHVHVNLLAQSTVLRKLHHLHWCWRQK